MKQRWVALAAAAAVAAGALVAAGGLFESGAKPAEAPARPPAATPDAPISASALQARAREEPQRREAAPAPEPEPETPAAAESPRRFVSVRAIDARTGEPLPPFQVTRRALSANGPGKVLRAATSNETSHDEVAVRYEDFGAGPFVLEVARLGYRTAYAPTSTLPTDSDPATISVALTRLG